MISTYFHSSAFIKILQKYGLGCNQHAESSKLTNIYRPAGYEFFSTAQKSWPRDIDKMVVNVANRATLI